jgi:hypothetical protein
MKSFIRLSVSDAHQAHVNSFIPAAEKETNAYFRSITTRDGVNGAIEYRRLLGTPAWGRMFLSIMDRMTIEAGIRVKWPRPEKKVE